MKRVLLRTKSFVRFSKKILEKYPDLKDELNNVFRLLGEDAFQTKPRAHKLRRKLEGYYACNLTYDIRITFRFVDYQGKEAILLDAIGTA